MPEQHTVDSAVENEGEHKSKPVAGSEGKKLDKKNDLSLSSSPIKRKPGKSEAPIVSSTGVEFSLENAIPHLTCRLCKSYFYQPVTITECLHTFCKACLYTYFERGPKNCPQCKVSLGTDPFKCVLADRSLEDLFDRTLFPELKESIDKLENEFYLKKGIKRKRDVIHAGEGFKGSIPAVQSDDEIVFKMYPAANADVRFLMPPMKNVEHKTSGRFKVVHIKRFLIRELSIQNARPTSIDLLYNGRIVGNELNLAFIERTIRVDQKSCLELEYRFSEDAFL